VTGLEVPRRGELEAALLRQAEPLRTLPRLAEVVRSLHRAAVDPVVRAGIEGAVARVDDRMVDRPALEQRTLDLKRAALVIAADEEEALARADDQEHTHDASLAKEPRVAKPTPR
jgi:hypothetical protein